LSERLTGTAIVAMVIAVPEAVVVTALPHDGTAERPWGGSS
jgi:hypothetical protein